MNRQALPPSASRPKPPSASRTSRGYLTISAGTGGKSYPLAGVRVEIYLETDTGAYALYRVQSTGPSGIAPQIPVPAPPEEDSLSPGFAFRPYTTARVRVFKSGYYPEEAAEVPVFAKTESLQYFELMPLPESAQFREPSDTVIFVSKAIPDPL